MHTLGTHFTELLNNIRPPVHRREAAHDLPPKVRDFIANHVEFETLYPHTRLAGSYAQATCVGDVKDVDFLVRVPGDPEENEPEAKRLVQDLKNVLDELPEYLGYNGEAAIDIERARRSVHVYFEVEDFHLDVVPCIAPDGFDEVLYVPDRGFNEWIPSHPIGYINLLRELDEEYHQKVRPLIKLLKHFRNYHMKTRLPKSYWLGALVIHHIRKDDGLDTTISLAELFHDLCDAVYLQYDHLLHTSETATPNIPDPLLDHNISWNWERSHFETFMRRLDDGRKWSKQALDCDDREEAIELWQKIFGEEYFPTSIENAASRMAKSLSPGSTSVTSSGLIVQSSQATPRDTSVRGTTFHGDFDA